MKLEEIKINYQNDYIRVNDYKFVLGKNIMSCTESIPFLDREMEYELIHSDADYYDYDLIETINQ